MEPNADIRALKDYLRNRIDRLREAEEAAALAGDLATFRSMGNQIIETEHRVRMLGRVEFAAATAALQAKLQPILDAKAGLDKAIAEIEKLQAFLKTISKFLGLVDKLIDLLA
jgi:hypothetical protein